MAATADHHSLGQAGLPTVPSNKGKPLTGVASQSYHVASAWEQTAVLSATQEQSIELLAAECSQRPVPEHLTQGSGAAQPVASSREGPLKAAQEHIEDVVLHSTNQFYKWHSELQAAFASETEEKYKQYAAELQGRLESYAVLHYFAELRAQHHEVSNKSRALTDSCERLVVEKERLLQFADALRNKLQYFDELERVSAQFHSASLAVDSDSFLPLLERLDECITYVSNNPQYADASSYASKFRQLQQRAMATMRTKVAQVLQHASEQVMAALREGRASTSGLTNGNSTPMAATPRAFTPRANIRGGPKIAEGVQQALLYVRFRTAAESGLKGLLAGIQARTERPEYARLLSDCQILYCDTRLQLVSGVTHDAILHMSSQTLPVLAREGWGYLMQVCQYEHQLFDHFFPGADPEGSSLAPLMDPLATILYDALRPQFIHIHALDELCEIVDILTHEVVEEQMGRRGEAVHPLRPVLHRTLADVQERLTFRAQAFIKDEVTNFQPRGADLDYPGKLQHRQEHPPTEHTPLTHQNGDAPSASMESDLEAYTVWYPPLRSSLLCLSKLYGSVDPKIFNGLAQDAVHAATASVQAASRQIAKQSSVMDAQLFTIKQLLILREQIAPFEADFAVTEYDLDFSHMRDHLRRIMAGKASLFTFSSNNAMVQLVSRGGPRILQNQVDSKKELEKQVKASCEAFIMAVTKLTVEPMLSFITKVTAVKVAMLTSSKRLREQAFASPERLAEMVQKVQTAMQTSLPKAVSKMRLYLNNPSTHSILFKPIKSNIAEAHAQIAALLEAEYTQQEVQSIQLTPPPALEKLLSL
ncbi:MAG: conserved oligomeric Golgi complex subunit 3-like [Trebouxia sp. A1-2]|nr:MAG: conserved oligomeric Golgi complex subunit 3-like [Trebouxia sp. A1-2]